MSPHRAKIRIAAVAAMAVAVSVCSLPIAAARVHHEPAGRAPQTTILPAETFGEPLPPSNVRAVATAKGIRVSWAPSAPANPAITHYVVHAGPNSCPVTVPASATTAVMPYIKDEGALLVRVQAVNDYGFSAPAAASPIAAPKHATPGYRNVQMLEFSDFHGAIEESPVSIGAAVLTTAFAEDRRAVRSTFAVSAGDNIGGSPVISSVFEERPTIEALNLAGLDVTTLGNHEHDRPLSHVRQMVDLSRFAWVESAYTTIKPLAGEKKRVKPFVVLNRGGVKVGFIGVNTADLAVRVPSSSLVYAPGKSLAIDDRTARLKREVSAARKAGAQLVVALVHRGWDINQNGSAQGPLIDIARALPGVDAVFGGDSHLRYASILSGNPVVQVPNSGVMYSRTTLCLNTRTERPIGSSVDFVTKAQLAGTEPDPATAALVASYRAALGAKLDEVVGTVDGIFPRGGTPAVERSSETPMGDFAADAIRARYGTDFAIINGGGIRDTLPASGYTPINPALRRPSNGPPPYDVALGDTLAVFPFNEDIATTTTTGALLWQALENGVSKWPSDGRFPQVSGLRFSFDPGRAAGSRVLDVRTAANAPIGKDATVYTISTLKFMVDGGDGYAGMFSPSDAIVREPLLDSVTGAFRANLAASRVTPVPAPDGRITQVS